MKRTHLFRVGTILCIAALTGLGCAGRSNQPVETTPVAVPPTQPLPVCKTCKGHGEVYHVAEDTFPRPTVRCPECMGKGRCKDNGVYYIAVNPIGGWMTPPAEGWVPPKTGRP